MVHIPLFEGRRRVLIPGMQHRAALRRDVQYHLPGRQPPGPFPGHAFTPTG